MKSVPAWVAIAAFAVPAAAQYNTYVFFPQDPERQTITCTSFVGRPDVANGAEALVPIDPAHLRSVADQGGAGVERLYGVYHWVADEKLSTIETYDLVVRYRQATGSAPDMSAAGEAVRIAGLTTPPSTSPLRGTWIMSDGFQNGGEYIGVFGTTYFVGVDLGANPLWPVIDGHSLFRADLLNAGTGATVGENHRAGAPDPTWAAPHGGTPFTTPWTYILGPFVRNPILHLGGIDPTSTRLGAPGANLSMNGLFPDVSGQPRSDGLVLRITDNLVPFGVLALAAANAFQQPNYFFGVQGVSYVLDPSGAAILLGTSYLQNGVRELTIAAPGTISPTLVGVDFVFQGVVVDFNAGFAPAWTTAQAVHF